MRPHNDPTPPLKGRDIKTKFTADQFKSSVPLTISKSRSCMWRRCAWIMEAVDDVGGGGREGGRGWLELTGLVALVINGRGSRGK